MKKATLFQYAIIWNPNEEQLKEGKKPELVVEPTTILADDAQKAMLMAARAIPEDRVADIDQLDIAVRPF